MLPLGLVAAGVGSMGTVTVSGEAIADVNATPMVGVRFNTDGTIDKRTGTSGAPTYTPIDTATDWIVPNSRASKRTFHVQATLNAESGGGTKLGTLSSWLEVSTAREWSIERLSGAGSGTSTWDLDIAISDDAGSTTLDTGLFEMDAVIL